jgi:hypothetical protein
MATKVFISWGGDLSKKLAECIRAWLPIVIQHVRPYFTPKDIEKGSKWGSEISGELDESNIGIICLTRENITRPWILFEAGALSKDLDKSKVCTILFDIDPADIEGPLTMFQATKFTKEDFKELLTCINNASDDSPLDQSVLDSVFETMWPTLEKDINEILSKHKVPDHKTKRSDRELLEEILELTRSNRNEKKSWLVPPKERKLERKIDLLLMQNNPHQHVYNQVNNDDKQVPMWAQTGIPLDSMIPGISKELHRTGVDPRIISSVIDDKRIMIKTKEKLPQRIKELIRDRAEDQGFLASFQVYPALSTPA